MKENSSWLAWGLLVMAMTFSNLCAAQTQGGESESERWFTVDALNTGLGEAPEEANRVTPRESIRSFLDLTGQEEYEAAAHMLNLADFSEGEQRERGSELARQLAEIFQRGEWLSVSDLPGREDAVIEDSSGQNPRVGETRRNVEVSSMQANGETYDIRLGRYRVGDQEPVWLIMPISVSYIPVLYEQYGPSMLENYIPKRFQASFGILRIWEWIAIPLFLVFVVMFGWGVHRLIGLMSKWLPSGMSSIFASQIGTPAALIAMSLVTQMLLDYVVSFSAVATTTFRVLLISILAWAVGTISLRLVDTIMLRLTRRIVGEIDDTKPRDQRRLLTSLYALRRLIILITVTGVSIYILGQIQLFESLGLSILASASVLAVLVGVAGQAVLGNILSSFQLSFAKPIRIGDLVIFEGQWCYVEGIFYTFIRLRTWDERRLIVPVTYFTSKPFENLSVKSTKMYRFLEVSLHLSADIDVLRNKFIEFAKEEDSVIEHHKLLCYVTAQTGTAQTVTCYLMTSDPMAGWAAEMSVREKLLAFIRDNYPEWWPREIVVISHNDIARGTQGKNSGEVDSVEVKPSE
ncbi:mechanosensitive ion channel family protein [Vreelandella neptunia]|uniref:Mechanosensitive ion channel family protein n=1 Tax=Vreelandella neptunia TaxID=115551 RepID=A0ABZ0YNI0_9GAMM|nr:mechanosensitive ion channel family protein [Halomonas neptunia]MDN3558722.1 mechanosensitive ion channel family protein [Halomonas neptunia]TDV92189.1 small-conductance mechanosensitive channel [Halomonas alkaliantarctica]WQH13690.1 mechanosensitive ion channel family protein [Halomonas neptunia]